MIKIIFLFSFLASCLFKKGNFQNATSIASTPLLSPTLHSHLCIMAHSNELIWEKQKRVSSMLANTRYTLVNILFVKMMMPQP